MQTLICVKQEAYDNAGLSKDDILMWLTLQIWKLILSTKIKAITPLRIDRSRGIHIWQRTPFVCAASWATSLAPY